MLPKKKKKRLDRLTAGPSSQWFRQHLNQQPPPDSQPRAWQLRQTGDGKANDELPESASAPTAGDSPSPARAAGMATARVRSSASPRKPKAGRAQLTQTTTGRGLAGNPLPACFDLMNNFFSFYHCIWGLCFLWKEVRDWKDVYENYYLLSRQEQLL